MTEGAFPMMTAEDMCAAVRRYVDAYNHFDVDAMLFDVHPDVEFSNISGGKATAFAAGIDALRRLAESSKALFSEREQRILTIDPMPDGVRIEVMFHGRLAQDLPSGLKRGQQLRLPGRSEFHFRDGMIDRIVDIS